MKPWRKWLGRALLLALLLAAGWLAWCGWQTAHAGRAALADVRRLQDLAGDATPAALPDLQANLAALDGHLAQLEAAGRPFLWLAPRLGWLPGIGADVKAAPELLAAARELSAGGRAAVDALAPVGTLAADQQGNLLARAVPVLATAGPQLAAADQRLAQAQIHRSQVSGPLQPRIAALLATLDKWLPLARSGLQAAQAAPNLLGANGPRTYLVLAQNDDELRATGGFISAVGVVRIENGRIADLQLGDSYSVDNLQQPHPIAPAVLSQQMGAQYLLLRDSNWSPDFLTTAQMARALYQQDQGVATDGAIALDTEAVRLLVAAVGPLDVPGMAAAITGDNVITQMRLAWAAPTTTTGTVTSQNDPEWWSKRKDFMGPLVSAALAKLQSGSGLKPAALAGALTQMLDGRHLQVAVDDPQLAALLAGQHWDGALNVPSDRDYLAVVDSNLGFNKVNAAVQQQVAYQVSRDAGRLGATLTLTYTHTAAALNGPCDRTPRYGGSYEEMIDRCYWDYVRVYVPQGSELLAAEGLVAGGDEIPEPGTTVFAGSFVLRPGDTQVVRLRYRLPDTVTAAPYRLFVRKQAGTRNLPFSVSAGPCAQQAGLNRDINFECDAWPN